MTTPSHDAPPPPGHDDPWAGRGLLDDSRAGGEPALPDDRRARIWAAVREETVGGAARAGAWALGGLAGTVAVAVAIMVLTQAPAPPTTPPAIVIATAAGHAVLNGATLEPAPDRPTLVRFRKSASARLSGGGKATFSSKGGGDTVQLHAGAVDVEVTPGVYEGGAPFAVEAGGYQVRVVGTVFEVDVDSAGIVEVSVDRGAVEVSGPLQAAVRVRAGSCWTSAVRTVRPCAGTTEAAPEPPPTAPEPAAPATGEPKHAPRRSRPGSKAAPGPTRAPDPARAPTTQAPSPFDEVDQLQRAGLFADAAVRLRSLSQAGGGVADEALYELARLQSRQLGQPSAAMASLKQYQRRFPSGALRPEVDLELVQVSVSRGLLDQALAASSAYLNAYPADRRTDEVRALRGAMLHSAGRHLQAASEYDAIGGGRFADEAAWRAAVCLQDAGRKAQARERVLSYLERFPAGRFAAQAMAALNTESLNARPANGHSDMVTKPKEQR